MAEVLQLSDQELDTTRISTPRALVDTAEATQGRTVTQAATEGPPALRMKQVPPVGTS